MIKLIMLLISPLFFVGWAIGFIVRPLVLGIIRGLYHLEFAEQVRQQEILDTYEKIKDST